jgi:hypothetical protein
MLDRIIREMRAQETHKHEGCGSVGGGWAAIKAVAGLCCARQPHAKGYTAEGFDGEIVLGGGGDVALHSVDSISDRPVRWMEEYEQSLAASGSSLMLLILPLRISVSRFRAAHSVNSCRAASEGGLTARRLTFESIGSVDMMAVGRGEKRRGAGSRV